MTTAPAGGAPLQAAVSSLFALMPNGFHLQFDDHLEVVSACGHGLSTLGRTPDELLGSAVSALFPPALVERVMLRLDAALRGEASSFELPAPGDGRLYLAAAPVTRELGAAVVDSAPGAQLFGAWLSVPTSATKITAADLQSDEALRLGEARYRALFEDIHTVIVLFDRATGRIVDVNPAAAAYYGWSREQMREMSVFDVHVPSPAEVWAELMRAEAEGRPYFRFRHRRADGSVRDLEAYSSPVELGDRKLHYAIMHDVTERNEAEEALRQSETALKRSQAVAHIGHWTWDTRRNTVTWSDEMQRIFGLDPEQFAGDLNKVIERSIHPDDAERVRAMNAAVVDEQRPGEAEYRVVWPDGTIHYVRAIPADSIRNEQGSILQLSGVVQDATERRLREVERELLLVQLQDKAEQLAQVMRSVPEGVLLLDNLGWILLANPRAEEMLRRLAQYSEGRRLLQLGDMALEALLTSPPLGQWHTAQAGRQIFELIANPVESGPVPAGWVLVLRDVTAERAVQEQLQRQERLAAVGQLAAGIAHDFNNIMSVISIYAELTSEVPGLTDKERARTHTIIEQAQRATRMIRQILDFSRQSVLERQALDLLPLLKEEEKLLRQTLPESIDIECYCAPGEYIVMGDPTRLQQLVMNLAVNARDAMPHGGQLRIALEKLLVTSVKRPPVPGMREGDWLCLTVQDTGTGIAPEHLAHIFEPFFTTKEPGKGTGLGLAQAHGIVAQHNGQIAVTSEPGIGTAFSIYLPALSLGVTSANPAPLADLPRGQGQNILVVEDEANLRTSLVELLTGIGYHVEEAPNGAEALVLLTDPARLTAAPVALILSDVVMPRMGGVALLKMLRQRGVQTPLVLMSGHPIGDDRAGLEQLGMTAWLDKPPSRWQLAHTVAAALQ